MRCAETVSASVRSLGRLGMVAVLGCLLIGCKSLLDQSELAGRPSSARLVVPILKSIDPIDEAETEFVGAFDVKPEDLKNIAADYVIGRNDLVTVSVYDLVGQGGLESVRSARVSETGMLSLPMLSEPIRAAGLTEQQLQKAIAEKYKQAELLQNARVSVMVVEARQRTFSVLGGVARPGQYAILDSDFRILNALVQAGDTTATPEYLYIVRKVSSERPATQPATETTPATQPTGPGQQDPFAPKSQGNSVNNPVLAMQTTRPNAAPAAAGDEGKLITVEGKPMVVGATRPATVDAPEASKPATAPETQPSTQEANQAIFEFGTGLKSDEDQRVIRIPLQALKNGDLRFNVVIRPSDTLIVPLPAAGFYYMGGHVGSPGAYNMTGQKITLKQAITAARMVDSLAVTYKTDVIRRVGDSEIFVRMNLDKVFEGRQPDIYLKPNDVVLVGTDFYPPFLQAIRGAFRFTYGFGFLYDRNFAPQQSVGK